jgi:integrase/recombinase XerD
MKIYFRLRANKSSTSTIYCRVSANQSTCKTDFSTNIQVKKKDWDHNSQRILADDFKNGLLQNIKHKLQLTHSNLLNHFEHENITGEMIKQAYLYSEKLLDIYDNFIEHKTKKVSSNTIRIYNTRKKLIYEYLKHASKQQISIKELNYSFVEEYEEYLKNKNYGHNYSMKQIQFLKIVSKYAYRKLKNTQFDAIEDYPINFEYPEFPIFLTLTELQTLEKYNFASVTLQTTKDLFLMQCYTGFAYNELKSFNFKNDVVEVNNKKMLCKQRGKTKRIAYLPLFSRFKELLEKYNYKPRVYSNVNYNKYLKEIAAILGIDKRLTTHVARKTAAMMWLNEGVSIEVVARMLGHADIRTTQRFYAKVLPERILRETAHLM